MNTQTMVMMTQIFDPVIMVLILSITMFITGSVVYKLKISDDNEWEYDNLSEDEKQYVDVIENNNDGLVEQKSISDSLDWSDAKTSRITTSLIDKNVITKERNDRTNYVDISYKNKKS